MRPATTQCTFSTEQQEIEAAILQAQRTVGAALLGDPSLPCLLRRLSAYHQDRFHSLARESDIDIALRHAFGALAALPLGHPDVPAVQHGLAVLYMDRYRHYDTVSDMRNAMLYARAAIISLESIRLKHHSAVGMHEAGQMRKGDPSALSEDGGVVKSLDASATSRSITQEGLEDPSVPHSSPLIWVGVLMTILDSQPDGGTGAHQDSHGSHDDIASAPSNDDLPKYVGTLAMLYTLIHERSADASCLQFSLLLFCKSLTMSKPDDPSLPGRLHGAGQACMACYRHTLDVESLDAAIYSYRMSLRRTRLDDPNLAEREHNLSRAYAERFDKLGDLDDLDEAIKYAQKSASDTPVDHALHSQRKQSFQDLIRQGLLGDATVTHLKDMLLHHHRALIHGDKGNPTILRTMQNLTLSYLSFYERFADMRLLENAFKFARSLVASTPSHDRSLARRQQTLAKAYFLRYRRLGDVDDLDSLLKWCQAAVEGTPYGHLDLAERQYSLSLAYQLHYDKFRDLESLQKEEEYRQKAVDSASETHPDLGFWKVGLSSSQLRASLVQAGRGRHDLIKEIGEASLEYMRGPIVLAAMQGSFLSQRIMNRLRVDDSGEFESELDRNQQLIRAMPLEFAERGSKLAVLARAYADRYETSRRGEDLAKATDMYRHAVHLVRNTSQLSVWLCANDWATFSSKNRLPETIEAYSAAFRVLPDLAWLGTSPNSRYGMLIEGNVAEISSQAVAAALESLNPRKAIEFFEAGLSISHKQSYQLRLGDTSLWKSFPVEAERLRDISIQLQGETGQERGDIGMIDEGRNQLALQRNELVEKIRARPGFENFLRPPNLDDLLTAADDGPVIILNAAMQRSDAIVLLPGRQSPVFVSLPGASPHVLRRVLSKLGKCLNLGRGRDTSSGRRHGFPVNRSLGDPFTGVLYWLWSQVVSPVFDCLDSNGIKSGRIWWCPSSLFMFLPIHAAGIEHGNKFVQSYTYSVQSLIEARERNRAYGGESRETEDIAIVGVSRAPHLGTLPTVRKEIQAAEDLFNKSEWFRTRVLVDAEASHSNVIGALPGCGWLHIACHGRQDLAEPLNSGLELFDRRLKLKDILAINMYDTAKFAYLSACETAMGDEKLTNEAMHLVGGFMSAGFRGAVGTMWSMADRYGDLVASTVYRKILGTDEGAKVDGDKKGRPRLELAAQGLHEAIRELRRRGAMPYEWMPFIHVGI